MDRVRTRFAPSPTGLLHLGNVRTALFNYLWARRSQGVFLLRIEDTDAARSRPEFVEALEQDLQWLGLAWQEGPGVGGPHAPYAQSQRQAIYERWFRVLESSGRVYPCFCTEQELARMRSRQLAAGKAPRYPGTCAALSESEVNERLARGRKPAWRFRVPPRETVELDDLVRGAQRFAAADIGDFIIVRADGTPAFLFSNAVDDALMEVTHVLRGDDHLSNTPRQLLLLKALDLPMPRYGHIPLILGQDDAPLAKRLGSASLRELREAGYLPGAVVNYLARLGHAYEDHGFQDLDALAAGFALEHLGSAPARFDPQQLLYRQRQAVARLDGAALWEWMGEWTGEWMGEWMAIPPEIEIPDRDAFVAAIRDNVTLPDDARRWARILFTDEPLTLDKAGDRQARSVIGAAGADFFACAAAAVERCGTDLQCLVRALKETGVKGRALFQPLRAALTGELEGPELARLLPLMGAERARRRLQAAQQQMMPTDERLSPC